MSFTSVLAEKYSSSNLANAEINSLDPVIKWTKFAKYS